LNLLFGNLHLVFQIIKVCRNVLVVGFCEDGSESSGYVKKGEIQDCLIEYLIQSLTDLFI
jgi:hypothetical protein